MVYFQADWLLILTVFVLITLPLLVAVHRLGRLVRILARIENLNLRSVRHWGG